MSTELSSVNGSWSEKPKENLGERDKLSEIPAVTQSQFFSPAFNAAIFDGPLRIYFAQYQEAEALKIYFFLQEKLGEETGLKEALKKKRKNAFLMLYPTREIFQGCFDGHLPLNARMAEFPFGEDLIIGFESSLEEGEYEFLQDRIQKFIQPQN